MNDFKKEYEQNIEDIGAKDVADGNAAVALRRRHHTRGQLRE